jgi:poly-gamma-glutamate capsule biosynthesis protein CapA/YwtB (metallophosphatase superfamily)
LPAGEFTLVVAGDVHFIDRTAKLLAEPATAFGPIAEVLRAADLTMVNLETAVTNRGVPEPKEFHFRTSPFAFNALSAAGIDAVTLANNHTLDYGRVGLLDTLDAAQHANFPVFGAGRNAAEAYAPWMTTVRGVRVAALGFMQVHELEVPWAAQDNRPGIAEAFDVTRALAAVHAARERADLVIVFNHWGTQGVACPNAEQKTFAQKLSAAGADIIVGSHAHVLQGSGWLGEKFIAYGMANFLWWGNSYSTETGVLRLTVRGRTVVKSEFLPAVVSNTGQPTLLTGAAADALGSRYAGLRGCAGLSSAPG